MSWKEDSHKVFIRKEIQGKRDLFSHVTRPSGSSALMATRGYASLPRVSGGLGGSVCGLPPDCTWQYQPRAVSEW